LCFTDMRLPDGRGLDILRHIQQHRPELPVAVITAFGNAQDAVDSLKAGAFDFVSKPVDLPGLKRLVEAALKLERAPSAALKNYDSSQLVGRAPGIQKLRELAAKLARSQAPVYISGESGSGKEMVARLIHLGGPRADQPFVPVNCGAIPRELMESEFFGHAKGSFTGAVRDKPGLFQVAHGGTLFLDEVAELSAPMQVKLLRALQERSIRPVGSEQEQKIDVRILCATHKSLRELTARGEFRQDLYYRLNVIEINVPALRERAEDIPLLCEHILARFARQSGEAPRRLSEGALRALADYPFPGNVRELENILERAVTLAEQGVIQTQDLQLLSAVSAPAAAAGSATAARQQQQTETSFTSLLEDKQRELIQKALEQARYNKTRAAKLLGISFRALRYRLKKLGLDS
ncbi:MAG: sigma-54-dependent transcriptional regulator, partial [Nevskiales bacterium]